MYWIDAAFPGRIALLPRPRGGDWLEDEIRTWSRAGVDPVVSVLTRDELEQLQLTEEEGLCRAFGIEFLSFPIPDRGIPASRGETVDLAARLAADLAEGRNIGIHCRQGIGRSAMMIAAVLIASGSDPDSALQKITAARGYPVPETPQQRQWVFDLARSFPPARARIG